MAEISSSILKVMIHNIYVFMLTKTSQGRRGCRMQLKPKKETETQKQSELAPPTETENSADSKAGGFGFDWSSVFYRIRIYP